MKILYVEDEPKDADLARRALAKAAPQYALDVVGTYQEALARLEQVTDYDLVLTDLKLPDGDGLTLLAHIRALGLPCAVVVISGRGDEETAVAALKSGADDYLVKHKDYLRTLPLTLENAHQRHRAELDLHARPLRVLYGEHHAADIDLTRRHLAQYTPYIRLEVLNTPPEITQCLSDAKVGGKYDVILLDYSLPALNTLDLIKEMVQVRRLDVPVVLVTGQGSEDVAVQAIKLGAADYVVKNPGYLFQLPGVLENAFQRAQLAREQAALRESESRYRDLVENIQDLICTHDLKGRLLSVNPAASRISGYSEDELLEMNLRDVLVPEVRNQFKVYLAEIQAKGSASGLMFVQTKSGEKRILEYNNTLRTVGVAEPIVRGMARDITERKHAEEALAASEAELRALFASMQDVVLVIDRDGVYRKIAPTNPSFLYKPAAELLGKKLADVFPAELAENFLGTVRHVLKTSQTDHIEYELTINDRSLWFSASITPMTADSTVWVARDITNRKQAEAALQRQLQELTLLQAVASHAVAVEEMLPLLLDETLAVLGAEAGILFLYDAGRDEIRKAAARSWFTRIPDRPLPAREGVTAQVLATGETYLSREFLSDPRSLESVRQQIPAGWGGACVPLRAAQEIVGFFFISVQLPRQLTENEVRLLTTLAEIAGNAIRRAALYEETEKQVQRLAALREIDMAISSSFDLRVTLNIVLNHILTQLKVDAADVLLLNPFLQSLDYTAGQGFRTPGITRSHLRLGEGFAGKAALERKLLHIPDLTQESDSVRLPLLAGENFIGYYGVPLVAKGEVKGVLEVFHRAPLPVTEEWTRFLESLESLAGQAAIAIDNAQLFDGLQRSNVELVLAYDSTLEGWAKALELRDEETEGHAQRVTEMTMKLARAMKISEAELVHVRRGALLHDIGKMGVSDSILLKPDKLTDEEWETMRRHPQYAFDMLSAIKFLRPALDIPGCHHEKWDGTGYPRSLKGEQIPLAARIFAVVDVWDALTSDRPYRKAWTKEKARTYIQEQSGKHFDPKVVEAFIREIE